MQNLTQLAAYQLAELIQSKQVSAEEVAKQYIQQIEKINPKINALCYFDAEKFLISAKKADALAAQKKPLGLLHGVPFSAKDNVQTAGIPTTAGSSAFLKNLPETDATVVKRMKSAGALLIGKTNMPDFAMSWDTDSSAFGKTHNPYADNTTCGGSSGGEAALIAACGSALSLANDGGGSIRLPAHYCGIAGLRPSIGLIPTTGHFPGIDAGYAAGAAAQIVSVGPMARSVKDLRLALKVLAGSDDIDPNTLNFNLTNPEKNIKNLRILTYHDHNLKHDPAILNVLQNVNDCLIQAGAQCEEKTPPGVTQSWDLFNGLLCADGAEGFITFLQSLSISQYKPNLEASLKIFSTGKKTLTEFNHLWMQTDVYRSEMQRFMQNYDAIVCPVSTMPAHSQQQLFTDPERFGSINYLVGYSLLGWPAVVVRAGSSAKGLPIGVQIITKYWQDLLALNIAEFIEQALGGWQAPTIA